MVKDVRVERVAPVIILAKDSPSQIAADAIIGVFMGWDHSIYFLKRSANTKRSYGMLRWPTPGTNISDVGQGDSFNTTVWLGHDIRAFKHLQPLGKGRYLLVSCEVNPKATHLDPVLGCVVKVRSGVVVRADFSRGKLGVEYELDLGLHISEAKTAKGGVVWVAYGREGLLDRRGHATRQGMVDKQKHPIKCFCATTGDLLYQVQSASEVLYRPRDLVAVSEMEVMFTEGGSIYHVRMEPPAGGGEPRGSTAKAFEHVWKGLVGEANAHRAWHLWSMGGEQFVLLLQPESDNWRIMRLMTSGMKIEVEVVAIRDDGGGDRRQELKLGGRVGYLPPKRSSGVLEPPGGSSPPPRPPGPGLMRSITMRAQALPPPPRWSTGYAPGPARGVAGGTAGEKLQLPVMQAPPPVSKEPRHVAVLGVLEGHMVCSDLAYAPLKKRDGSPSKKSKVLVDLDIDEEENILLGSGRKKQPLASWFYTSHLAEHVNSVTQLDEWRPGTAGFTRQGLIRVRERAKTSQVLGRAVEMC